MPAYKAEYRRLTRRQDLLLVEENIKDAADAARRFFRAIGLLGLPFSKLIVRRIHTARQAFSSIKT